MWADLKNYESFSEYKKEKFYTVERLSNLNTNISGKKFSFNIDRTESFLMLDEARLGIRASVKGKDGDDDYFIESGYVSPVSNIWHMINRAELYIDNNLVDSYSYVGDMAHIESVLETSGDYLEGQATSEMIALDRDDVIPDFNKFLYVMNNDFNYSKLATAGTAAANLTVNASASYSDDDILEFSYKGEPVDLYYYNNDVLTPIYPSITDGTNDGSTITCRGPALEGDEAAATIDNTTGIKLFTQDMEEVFILDAGNNPCTLATIAAGVLQVTKATAVATPEVSAYSEELYNSEDNRAIDRRRRHITKNNSDSTEVAFGANPPIRKIFPFLKKHLSPFMGAKIRIEFTFGSSKQQFITRSLNSLTLTNDNNPSDLHYYLWDLYLEVPVVKYKENIRTDLISMWLDGSKEIKYINNLMEINSEVRNGTTQSNFLMSPINGKPVKMFLTFRKSSKVNNYNKNNGLFDNANLSELWAEFSGSSKFPHNGFRVNFQEGTEKDIMEAYTYFLDACGLSYSNRCQPSISLDEWAEYYPIYCIDTINDDLFRENSTVQPTIKFRFNSAIQEDYDLLVLVKYEKKVSINYSMGRITQTNFA